ncbi:MAG TPA: RNA polymerase sigma factor [Kofleriaceae bacterium]|jgi:RNA polymerase sigma-70 factor (ECF subfamily)
MEAITGELARGREAFFALVGDLRPELHRYCARLTGSVIEGEDLVQETLAKALYALSLSADVPPLRPWLFRIAHNTAIDYLRSHGRARTELADELEVVDEPADPATVRAALSRFLALPVAQRSAVILKDVLGQSLEEIAETTGATIPAVKASLVRGRARLRDAREETVAADASARAQLAAYAALFNARDWAGVRALIAEDCRLDLVAKSQRRGREVQAYFSRYEREDVQLRLARLEGQLALAAFEGDAERPKYFILLEIANARVSVIRDFRYVGYIAGDADYEVY